MKILEWVEVGQSVAKGNLLGIWEGGWVVLGLFSIVRQVVRHRFRLSRALLRVLKVSVMSREAVPMSLR